MDTTISIQNAPWWANHSHVILRGLYTASDEAHVTNSIVSVTGAGTANVGMETRAGDQAILKVQRMVAQGTVAVMLRSGHKYEVQLPGDAGKLLPTDLSYISAQIDALSQPMSAEEQTAFLASQNGHAEATLQVVK
jgi:hypothetical protein